MARLRLGLGSPSPLGFASESTVLGSPSTGGLDEAAPAQGGKERTSWAATRRIRQGGRGGCGQVRRHLVTLTLTLILTLALALTQALALALTLTHRSRRHARRT